MNQGWYFKEKLDVSHSLGLQVQALISHSSSGPLLSWDWKEKLHSKSHKKLKKTPLKDDGSVQLPIFEADTSLHQNVFTTVLLASVHHITFDSLQSYIFHVDHFRAQCISPNQFTPSSLFILHNGESFFFCIKFLHGLSSSSWLFQVFSSSSQILLGKIFLRLKKLQSYIRLIHKHTNTLTPISDQDRISPYNINTISCRQVMRIEKNIS